MQYSVKTKIGVVIGIGLIITVVSFLSLPFLNEDSGIQKISEENIKKLDSAEDKLLGVIDQEKSEIEFKMGGKLKIP